MTEFYKCIHCGEDTVIDGVETGHEPARPAAGIPCSGKGTGITWAQALEIAAND